MTRALVTGATGYIGSHLGRHLVDSGWTVHAVVRRDSSHERLHPDVICHIHDGTAAGMRRLVADAAPDVVFHLASLVQGEHSTTTLDAIVAANVGLGAQLLDAMASAKCLRLVEAGSYWEYDADGGYHPNSFYAAAKHAFRAFVPYYVDRHGLSATTLILYDVYGSGDWRGKFLSHMLRSLQRNEPLAATPGEQLLDFVHVDDVSRGFHIAAQMEPLAEPGQISYRLDSGEQMTLRDATELMARLAGRPARVTWGARPYPPAQIMKPLAVGPRLPGWEPKIPLDQGFRMLLQDAGLTGVAHGALRS